MPTYEYRCAACEHEFEAFQSMSAKPLTLCPKCKKRKAKRLISAGAGLIFKGSGFYLTDYARKGGQSKKQESKAAATDAADKPATDSSKSAVDAATAKAPEKSKAASTSK